MRSSEPDVRGGAAVSTAELALAMIDALDHPAIACDAAGRNWLASRAARELIGVSDELDPERAAWLSDEGDEGPRALGAPLRDALAGVPLAGAGLWLAVGDGEFTPVRCSAYTLRDRDGEAVGAMLTITPIAEQASGDNRLRDHASDLEVLDQVSTMLAEVQDFDQAASVICMVTTGVTGALAVLLWESSGAGLVLRYAEGAVADTALRVIGEHATPGAASALAGARSVIESLRFPAAEAAASTGTAWHQPLSTAGAVTGALSIVWSGPVDDVERLGMLIRSLATHAATALERATLLRRLNEAARTDPLTGVANRRTWEEAVDRELARGRRDGRPISMVLLDIDHFKAYNDRLGHPRGDQLLRQATAVWSAQLRMTDIFARVGGEEFAVLLPACSLGEAAVVAERLREVTPDGQTCSLGAVVWDGSSDADALYARADAALYRAKRGGRNRVEIEWPPVTGALSAGRAEEPARALPGERRLTSGARARLPSDRL